MDSSLIDRRKKPKEVFLDLNKSKSDSTGGTLIGKVMTDKLLNRPTVISMVKKGWQMNNEVNIHEMDKSKSIFLFQFNKVEDAKWVLSIVATPKKNV